jgi:hypothetical protein
MTGRPTLYNDEIVAKAQAYLDNLPADEVVHSIEGVAIAMGITRETVYQWEDEEGKEIFSDIVKQVRLHQARTLVNSGLKGDFNSKIAAVMLSKHGYREGHDVTTDGKALPTPIYGGQSDPEEV